MACSGSTHLCLFITHPRCILKHHCYHCLWIKLCSFSFFSLKGSTLLIILNMFICFYKQIRWFFHKWQINRKFNNDARSLAMSLASCRRQVCFLANHKCAWLEWLRTLSFLFLSSYLIFLINLVGLCMSSKLKHFGYNVCKHILMESPLLAKHFARI